MFERIRLKGIKRVDHGVLEYIIGNTSNCEEVKFVINKLETLGVRFREKDYIFILSFIDDYDYTKKVFKKLKNYKLKHKLKNPISTHIYNLLLETTYTLEEAEDVILEMKKDEVDIPTNVYLSFIEKQKDYREALKIFNKYILSSEFQRKRVKDWENGNLDDPMRYIYGIMYIKSQDNDEQKQIIHELKRVKMSTNINDYSYLKIKSSIRRVFQIRKLLKQEINSEHIRYAVDNFFKKEGKSSIREVGGNSKKIEKVSTVYERNRNLVEELKRLHGDKCQICGQKLNLGDKFYSEVHHIQPLHLKGPDTIENMIVLCPNHHILFDRGAIRIELNILNVATVKYIDGKEEKIRLSDKHKISKEYIDFHNKNIFMKTQCNNYRESIQSYNVTFGNNIILINTETKEEIKLKIEENRENLSYLGFQLLEKKIGDSITIDSCNFLISEIN